MYKPNWDDLPTFDEDQVREKIYAIISDAPLIEEPDDIVIPPFMKISTEYGIRDAAKRHDALARRKYVKPFKWFKFNRARKATAK